MLGLCTKNSKKLSSLIKTTDFNIEWFERQYRINNW